MLFLSSLALKSIQHFNKSHKSGENVQFPHHYHDEHWHNTESSGGKHCD
jgi:hypothetical protein